MQIQLEVIPWLTRAMGNAGSGKLTMSLTCQSGDTVGTMLSELMGRHPDLASVLKGNDGSLSCPHANICVNGKLLSVPRGLEQTIVEGDIIVLFPPFAGG